MISLCPMAEFFVVVLVAGLVVRSCTRLLEKRSLSTVSAGHPSAEGDVRASLLMYRIHGAPAEEALIRALS